MRSTSAAGALASTRCARAVGCRTRPSSSGSPRDERGSSHRLTGGDDAVDLYGGVAVVSGGASGLGAAAPRAPAARGAHVAILDLPGSQGAALAAELGGSFVATDVTDPAGVEAALATAS